MANLKPTPKMAATGVAFGPAILVVWVAGQLGIDMPAEVAAVIVGAIMWLAGYLKSEGILKRKDGRYEKTAADA